MTRAQNDIEKAVQAFLRLLSGDDPAAMLRETEVAKGYRLVPVGSVSWLPAEDWGKDDVVTTNGIEVRLVAIKAKQPRNGAFTRLLAALLAARLTPVVVCPMDDMEGVLRRWGWKHREIGVDFDTREDQWRPPVGWEPRTEARASDGTGPPPKASAAAGGPDSRQGGSNGQQHH
jgi:hypothetical protein